MHEIEPFIEKSKFFYRTSYYAQHCVFPMWRSFNLASYEPPKYFLRPFCDEVKTFLIENCVSTQDVIKHFAEISLKNSSYFWVSQCILKHGARIQNDYNELCLLASGDKELPASVNISIDILAHAVASYIIDYYQCNCSNFEILVHKEQFAYPITDYKLTKVNGVVFKQNGFLFDNKYYLYNHFIDRSPLKANDEMPGIFRILSEKADLTNADFYLRLDEQLAIPSSEFDNRKYAFGARYYGPQFKYASTNLQHSDTFIVHGNPETNNKLLMVVKKRFDKKLGKQFWHVELEELPYHDKSESISRVTTTFIHGQYYPDDNVFRHIDFIKNQYGLSNYCDKYSDRSNSDISIDFYATKDCHYKIWCIENINIPESVWYQIAVLTLHPEYSSLFEEMLGMIQ